jgi:hypothetical protein
VRYPVDLVHRTATLVEELNLDQEDIPSQELVERIADMIAALGDPEGAAKIRQAKFDKEQLLKILSELAPDTDST